MAPAAARAPGEMVPGTFINSIGAIQISRTTRNATLGSPQPLAGVTFKIADINNNLVNTAMTDLPLNVENHLSL